MTQRTKLYIRNVKGKRIHCIIFRGLSRAQAQDVGERIHLMNKAIKEGKVGPFVGISIPSNVDYQVIKL